MLVVVLERRSYCGRQQEGGEKENEAVEAEGLREEGKEADG